MKKFALLVGVLALMQGLARGDGAGTQPGLVDEAKAAKVPVVLRVKWKAVSPPGGNPSDTVRVLQIIKNTSNKQWGKVARIDHEPGQDGVPEDQECTVYLEIDEKLKGSPWALFGGGAKTGVSHVGAAASQPAGG